MPTIPKLTLNDGNSIPQLGLGTWQVDPADAAQVVADGLAAGYRHIDTAQMYENEAGVGEGIRASGLARDEVFVTSKLSNKWHRPDDARRAMDETLEALGMEYVDLYLIHWPLPMHFDGDFVSTWQTLEGFKRDGRARSVGVSNFTPAHLERLAEEAETVPAVNQVEAHPFFGNEEARAYGQVHGIVTEAWSPLAQGRALTEPMIGAIAEKLGRAPSQVVLRWHIQRGDVVFPKTLDPARMRQNLGLFDFELDTKDMATISELDRGEAGRIGGHPDEMAWVPA